MAETNTTLQSSYTPIKKKETLWTVTWEINFYDDKVNLFVMANRLSVKSAAWVNKLLNINMIIHDMNIIYATRKHIYVEGDMIGIA